MSQFLVLIQLGNDAMRTREDIAEALRKVVERLTSAPGLEGAIRDANGNRVGQWVIDTADLCAKCDGTGSLTGGVLGRRICPDCKGTGGK